MSHSNKALSLGICFILTVSCKSSEKRPQTSSVKETSASCVDVIGYDQTQIKNYGLLPVEQSNLPDKTINIYERPSSAEESKEAVAQLFNHIASGDCSSDVMEVFTAGSGQPAHDVYIYFAGYGGAYQPNNQSWDSAMLKWINDRDPNALIVALGWSCEAAQTHGHTFCQQRADVLKINPEDPLVASIGLGVAQLMGSAAAAPMIAQGSAGQVNGEQGYNLSISHATEMAIKLIDHLLMIDQGSTQQRIRKIHLVGYSGGAHAVADTMRDTLNPALPGATSQGYQWTAANVCESGGNQCTVSGLNKLGWGLAMGLSGWSHAVSTHDFGSLSSQEQIGDCAGSCAYYDLYYNGGLFRASHNDYNNKLVVLNRRMDPTGNSNHSVERGANDMLYADYNHYSHDYSKPIFVHDKMTKALDAFLENPENQDLPEFGIITDIVANVDFDECSTSSGTCSPSTHYFAHAKNRSHNKTEILTSESTINVVADGVSSPYVPEGGSLAGDFSAGNPTMLLRTFDQEDLRGSIEFYFKPNAGSTGSTKGLFSYGGCQANAQRQALEPYAYFNSEGLHFSIKSFEGDIATATIGMDEIDSDSWNHYSFSWSLPTINIVEDTTDGAFTNTADASLFSAINSGGQLDQTATIASKFSKPSPSSFKAQKGQGKLLIHINGELKAQAPIGTSSSSRPCLSQSQVLEGNAEYKPGYEPYVPYANYKTDTLSVPAGQVTLTGGLCKGYRIRNMHVEVGCSEAPGSATADGLIDELAIILGEGRRIFSNVSATGQAKEWSKPPEGMDLTTRYQR